MPGSAQQLTMFGSPEVYGPARVFAMGLAATECNNCGVLSVPRPGDDWVQSRWGDDRPIGSGWVRDGRRWTRTIVVWVHCCERQCGACNSLVSPLDGHICENCEACGECCECIYCEGCDRYRSDSFYHCGSCGSCESCCSCCSGCGYFRDACECYDEDDRHDDDDSELERVCDYLPGTLEKLSSRTFGVELECIGIGERRAAAALRANNLESVAPGYSHHTCAEWKTVPDTSVYRGCEAVSPILRGEDGHAQVSSATMALLANGADVDESCGTHVHVGCEDLTGEDLARVVLFYDSAHSAIDLLHSADRRGSAQYSGPHAGSRDLALLRDLPAASDLRATLAGFPRYRSVNLTAWPKYGTIEFRQHAGTLNGARIEAWTRFLIALISAAIAGAVAATTLEGLLDQLTHYGLGESDRALLARVAVS